MVKGHLDRVTNLSDLIVEATDVLVRDIGNFGGEQLLNVLAHDALERDARTSIRDERVAGAQVSMAERAGQLKQCLRTAFRRHEHAVGADELENGHDLPAAREVIRGNGDHRVVEAHPLPVRQVSDIKLRGDGNTHALTAGDDLDLPRRRECSHECGQSLRRT